MTKPEADAPLFAGLWREIGQLKADLRTMFALRWQLARLELGSDLRAIKRLVVGLVVSAVMLLTALPPLVVAAADLLDGRLGIGRAGWLAIFSLALLLGGAATAYLAQRRFRARFTGLEQTRDELCEDLQWLQDWSTARGQTATPPNTHERA